MNYRQQLAGRRKGERLKGDAFSRIEARRKGYLRQARRALLEAKLRSGTATADDVRASIKLPDGVNPKVFGAVPAVLAKGGISRRDGFTRTSRPTAHARPVTVWRLADEAAARRWLAENQPLSPMAIPSDLPPPSAATDGASVQSTLPGFDVGGSHYE